MEKARKTIQKSQLKKCANVGHAIRKREKLLRTSGGAKSGHLVDFENAAQLQNRSK